MPFLIPLLSQLLAPTVTGWLTSAGLGSGLASILAPAAISGLGTWAATGEADQGLQGALLGGLGGALGGMGQGANAAGNAAASGVGEAVNGVVTDAARAAQAASVNPAVGNAWSITDGAAGAPTGGIMGWVRNHPAMAIGLGSAVLPMLGGAGASAGASNSEDGPVYHEANPVARHVVPYGTGSSATAGPSTYVAGDNSMDNSVYRYGQNSGEHMFFDPVPNSRQYTVDTGTGQDYTFNGGGMGDSFWERYFANHSFAAGGPVTAATLPAPMAPMAGGRMTQPPGWTPPLMRGGSQFPTAPMGSPPPFMGDTFQPTQPSQPLNTSMVPPGGSLLGATPPGVGPNAFAPIAPLSRPPMPMTQQPSPMMQRPSPFGQMARPMGPMPMSRPGAGLASPMMRRASGGPIAGPGHGQADQIPAMLSDGEFVVPADVVSALGAGSNNAGANQLSDMMQRVRLQAYGNAQQPLPVDPRVMPA